LQEGTDHKDGKEELIAKAWHSSGQLKSEVNYKGDKRHGLLKEWWNNGQLKSKVNWKDGVQDRLLRHWFENGQLQRDTTDEYAANMQKRSDKAIHDRDESTYALKEALVEVEKYKGRLKIAESLIGSGRPKESNNKSLITPISVGMTEILAIVIFGKTFS
jgi:antitoxin component YwqK of YwqJK toxin-antitoxin module